MRPPVKSRNNLEIAKEIKQEQSYVPSTRTKKKWTDATFIGPLGRTGGAILSYLLNSTSCTKNGRVRVTRQEFLNAIPGIRSFTTVSNNLKKLQDCKIITAFMVRMRNKIGKFITSKIYVFTEENIAKIQQLFPNIDLSKWGIKPYSYGDQFLVATKVIRDNNKRSENRQKLLQNPESISSMPVVRKLGNCIAKCISSGVQMLRSNEPFHYPFSDTEEIRGALYRKILKNVPDLAKVKDQEQIPRIIGNLVESFVQYQLKANKASVDRGKSPFKTSFWGWDTVMNKQVEFIKKGKLVMKETEKLSTASNESADVSFAYKEVTPKPSSPTPPIRSGSISRDRLIATIGSTRFDSWFRDVVLPDPSHDRVSIKVPNAWLANKIDEMFGSELTKIYGKGYYELIF